MLQGDFRLIDAQERLTAESSPVLFSVTAGDKLFRESLSGKEKLSDAATAGSHEDDGSGVWRLDARGVDGPEWMASQQRLSGNRVVLGGMDGSFGAAHGSVPCYGG